MKVNVKKYEQLLIILLASLTIVKYVLQRIGLTSTYESGFRQYLELHPNIKFDHVPSLFLARVGIIVLLLFIYFWINSFTIPRYLMAKSKSFFTYLIILIQILALSYLLAIGVNIASYYAHPSWNNYGEFSLFALFGYNEQPLTNLWAGFGRASVLIVIYGIFAVVREYLTFRIEHSRANSGYKILIANKIFIAFYIFFVLPVFLPTFYDVGDNDFYRAYFIIVPPTILVYLCNTYWLFPELSNSSSAYLTFIKRLLVSTLFFSLPFVEFLRHSVMWPKVWMTNWIVQFLIVTPITWILYRYSKDKIKQLRGAEVALSRSTADLLFLRSQINPHFLFNALNTLYGTALIDGSKRTANGIQMLGDMMRFMLDDNHLNFIPLDNEINYLQNYIAFQKLRAQDSNLLTVTEKITIVNCTYEIVPMLLIPLIENAFKHGIDVNKKSWIEIDLICDSEKIHLKVKNSLHHEEVNDPEKKHSGIGLRNVKERLMLFYKQRHELNYGATDKEFIAELIIEPETYK